MNLLVCEQCAARVDRPDLGVSVAASDHGSSEAFLVCPQCGHKQAFRRLPLLCLTGPSGTGKSTVARILANAVGDDVVVLEQDVLWQAGLRDSGRQHPVFRTAWLRMAAMIHQSGRPVVLVGTVVPPEFESLPERELFSDIHYLALTCDVDVLADRLRARPAWREWDEARIAETVEFAAWIERDAAVMAPPMTLLDTTDASVEETAAEVAVWVRATVSRRFG